MLSLFLFLFVYLFLTTAMMEDLAPAVIYLYLKLGYIIYLFLIWPLNIKSNK